MFSFIAIFKQQRIGPTTKETGQRKMAAAPHLEHAIGEDLIQDLGELTVVGGIK
jgi:hypothetical protein